MRTGAYRNRHHIEAFLSLVHKETFFYNVKTIYPEIKIDVETKHELNPGDLNLSRKKFLEEEVIEFLLLCSFMS